MSEIPSSFYYVAGFFIISNVSVVITLLVFIFKAGMFVNGTKLGIKDAKDSAIRAHKRIDKLEE